MRKTWGLCRGLSLGASEEGSVSGPAWSPPHPWRTQAGLGLLTWGMGARGLEVLGGQTREGPAGLVGRGVAASGQGTNSRACFPHGSRVSKSLKKERGREAACGSGEWSL